MPTLKAVVLKHQIREDGTYNIKIRVTHERQSAYIATEHYVGKKQVSADCKKIKDNFILEQIEIDIRGLRKEISKLGPKVSLYTAKELADYLSGTRKTGADQGLDFFRFAEEKIREIRTEGRDSTADSYASATNNLRTWLCRDYLDFKEITSKFLRNYETYLRGRKGMGSRGLESNLVYLRGLFNFARDKYNDEDLDDIKIPHYPFAKYKIPKSDEPEKRSLPVELIRKIQDYKYTPTSKFGIRKDGLYRANFARDAYLLSFYLVGINSKDMFYLPPISGDRIVYNRAKTKGRRADKAEISIKIEPVARELLEKYKDPDGVRALVFYKMYSDEKVFNSGINKGLKDVGESIGVPGLEYYSARHSWATIARNDCDISKDDISLSLNHADPDRKVTDTYIRKDWSRIDRANEKVLKLLFNRKKKTKSIP